MVHKELHQVRFAYAQLPYQRNQDIVRIDQKQGFIASIVDGHNNPSHLPGDQPGKTVARFVAEHYPQQFLSLPDDDVSQKARKAAVLIDEQVMEMYPSWASAVGAFLFSSGKKDTLVVVGSVFAYVWNGQVWEKPEAIGDYEIDPQHYPMDVSRFFGYRNLKEESTLYSCLPDTVVYSSSTPLFIATDGTEELLSVDDLNRSASLTPATNPQKVIDSLTEKMKERKKLQNDDATIFLKM